MLMPYYTCTSMFMAKDLVCTSKSQVHLTLCHDKQIKLLIYWIATVPYYSVTLLKRFGFFSLLPYHAFKLHVSYIQGMFDRPRLCFAL